MTMKTGRLFLGLVPLLTVGVLRADNAEDRNKVEDKRVEILAQERAVRAVERLEGYVVRDEKAPGKPVVTVCLSGALLTDMDLKDLASLEKLQALGLYGTSGTDAGLKELPALKQLQVLDLEETQVTDTGLKVLFALERLHI